MKLLRAEVFFIPVRFYLGSPSGKYVGLHNSLSVLPSPRILVQQFVHSCDLPSYLDLLGQFLGERAQLRLKATLSELEFFENLLARLGGATAGLQFPELLAVQSCEERIASPASWRPGKRSHPDLDARRQVDLRFFLDVFLRFLVIAAGITTDSLGLNCGRMKKQGVRLPWEGHCARVD